MTLTKPTNVRWYVFFTLLVLCTINYVDRAVISVCMPEIQKDLGFSPAMVGVILSSFFWSYATMQVPSGWIVDRFGAGRVIIGSGVLWGAFQIMTGAVSSALVFIIIRVLLGFSESPMYPAAAKLQSVWLTAAERGRGAALMDAGSAAGTAIGGPIVIAFMAWLGGWRMALVGAGILTVIVVILCRKLVIGTPDTHPMVNQAECDYLKQSLAAEYESDNLAGELGADKINYLANRSFWGLLLGMWGYCALWWGLVTWGPIYLAATQHLNIMGVGGAVFIIFGIGVIGELIGGYVADILRRKGLKANAVYRLSLLTVGVLAAISLFLLTRSTSIITAITFLSVAVFFNRWAGCLYWSLPATITKKKHVGAVAGAMNFAGNIGGITTPIFVGLIVQATNGSYFWALIMFLGFALVMGAFPLMIDMERKMGSKNTNVSANQAIV